jgi:AraC-like DNA-binding protein
MDSLRVVSQSRDTVSAGFVQGILAGLEYRASERLSLLEHAEIASDTLNDARLRVPLQGYTTLYRLVTETLHDEGFGLFSRALRPGFLEWLARPCVTAPNLAEALRRVFLQLNLLQDNLHLAVACDEVRVTLSITVIEPLPTSSTGFVFAHEWLLRLIHGLCAWLVEHPLPSSEARFPYPPPAHADDYALIFAQRAVFNAASLEIDFPLDYLALPVRRDEFALQEFLAATPANITRLYRREHALAARVRQLLRERLPEFLPLEHAARQLALSPRSLHRHLDAEGTSYRVLRDAVRHELALEWLAKTDRPVTRIATDLGFADSTSFYRAFAAHEGCGPRAWRQQR